MRRPGRARLLRLPVPRWRRRFRVLGDPLAGTVRATATRASGRTPRRPPMADPGPGPRRNGVGRTWASRAHSGGQGERGRQNLRVPHTAVVRSVVTGRLRWRVAVRDGPDAADLRGLTVKISSSVADRSVPAPFRASRRDLRPDRDHRGITCVRDARFLTGSGAHPEGSCVGRAISPASGIRPAAARSSDRGPATPARGGSRRAGRPPPERELGDRPLGVDDHVVRDPDLRVLGELRHPVGPTSAG